MTVPLDWAPSLSDPRGDARFHDLRPRRNDGPTPRRWRRVTDAGRPDPRLGLPVAHDKTTTYHECGLRGTVLRALVALGASTDGTTARGTLLDSTRVNGRLFVDSTDLATRTTLSRSAMGRRATSIYDQRGQTRAQDLTGGAREARSAAGGRR